MTARSRRTRLIAVASLALVAAAGAAAHSRLRGDEPARIRAGEAADLAEIERGVAEIVERARADMRVPGVWPRLRCPTGGSAPRLRASPTSSAKRA